MLFTLRMAALNKHSGVGVDKAARLSTFLNWFVNKKVIPRQQYTKLFVTYRNFIRSLYSHTMKIHFFLYTRGIAFESQHTTNNISSCSRRKGYLLSKSVVKYLTK